jgi:hypothetical protein
VQGAGQLLLAMLDPIYGVPEWFLALMFLGGLLAASELGFRHGFQSSRRVEQDTKVWIITIAASILGVLGLLLAFTINMAVSRYDIRRLLVLDEANALGTAFWRAQLVPPPEGPEMANLLREYTAARIQFSTPRRVQFGSRDDERLIEGRERSGQLQKEIWSRAAAFAQRDPRSVTAGLLLQSLNLAFDLEESRWIAFHTHVPTSVIWTDSVVALLASVLVGYSLGLAGRRNFTYLFMLVLCLTVVMTVIVDLDDPRHGFIRVSPQPLLDVQRHMGPPTH